MKSYLILASTLIVISMSNAATDQTPEDQLAQSGWISEVFKQTDATELKIWHMPPSSVQAGQAAPAMIFFYGGGWTGRRIDHFKRQGELLAAKGMHVFLPDYRSQKAYGGTPFDCVEDAKSAVRYIRSNAERFNIDPNKIAAGGGSAGGHLAAACALLPGLNDPDDPDIDCRPNALVLFNPVYDNDENGYGYDRVRSRWKEISPMYHINEAAPPNIVFLGTEDQVIPVETAEEWKAKMNATGVRSELYLYEGRKHGFFNGGDDYKDTNQKMVTFLESLNFIPTSYQ